MDASLPVLIRQLPISRASERFKFQPSIILKYLSSKVGHFLSSISLSTTVMETFTMCLMIFIRGDDSNYSTFLENSNKIK